MIAAKAAALRGPMPAHRARGATGSGSRVVAGVRCAPNPAFEADTGRGAHTMPGIVSGVSTLAAPKTQPYLMSLPVQVHEQMTTCQQEQHSLA